MHSPWTFNVYLHMIDTPVQKNLEKNKQDQVSVRCVVMSSPERFGEYLGFPFLWCSCTVFPDNCPIGGRNCFDKQSPKKESCPCLWYPWIHYWRHKILTISRNFHGECPWLFSCPWMFHFFQRSIGQGEGAKSSAGCHYFSMLCFYQ